MNNFTLTIPADLYARAKKIAQIANRSVEAILLEHLELSTSHIPELDESEERELQALKYLSDDALSTIAHETLNPDLTSKMQLLMDKNSTGIISDAEHDELAQLVERSEKMMLRKSEALAILHERGININALNT